MDEANTDNFQVVDILKNADKQKRLNSKVKGNRVERNLCKLLTAHFGRNFSRSVGSGNRWGQVTCMPEHARQTLSGDICPPENFKWVIECKGGYEDKIDLNSALDGGCACLDEFVRQSAKDADFSHRKPIIIWKRSRKPWLAMLRREILRT